MDTTAIDREILLLLLPEEKLVTLGALLSLPSQAAGRGIADFLENPHEVVSRVLPED